MRCGKRGHVVGRGHQARRWIVAGCYLMAAPLLPVGAGFFYAGQGPTPASLAVTVVAGATAVLCFIAGVGAARTAHTAPGARHRAAERRGGRPTVAGGTGFGGGVAAGRPTVGE